MNGWALFLVAIGCLLITVSPQLPSSALYLIIGLVLILIGGLKIKKNKN